ncbi:hypothetical protein F2Q70_00013389 [Brassica cretica]|uniref:Uncharacterized protein n=1 Tax=Brassica cretica TaxID=69181 RepID=A0A8S9M6T6_BRACR|nr:hypothetical protein F2Q70_00013389 [Brassica cretica]
MSNKEFWVVKLPSNNKLLKNTQCLIKELVEPLSELSRGGGSDSQEPLAAAVAVETRRPTGPRIYAFHFNQAGQERLSCRRLQIPAGDRGRGGGGGYGDSSGGYGSCGYRGESGGDDAYGDGGYGGGGGGYEGGGNSGGGGSNRDGSGYSSGGDGDGYGYDGGGGYEGSNGVERNSGGGGYNKSEEDSHKGIVVHDVFPFHELCVESRMSLFV